jgi:hypothetical protein
VPYREWKLYEMRPGNADIKYPWELARCQHWVTLGQAFLLTGDDRFALEIARELQDFIDANPLGIGINWTCTMDIALRAVSWALGLVLVSSSQALDDRFRRRAYSSLYDHGIFIRNNLENTYEVTSNHFLSNIVGLWFLGVWFGETESGCEWKAFSRRALEHEITIQVLKDGADFESSVPYHRLVTELFLAPARLGDLIGEPLSANYRSRVREMIAYLASVIRPDGLMPQVGDADDGRLHVFTGYGSTSPQDPAHLFGPAAVMFDEPSWLALAGSAGAWEAAWWGLQVDEAEERQRPSAACESGSRLFQAAGVAAMRTGTASYLLVTNGVVGTNGFGNHKHNDQLSFEYHCDGVPLVVDPGSYVYTADQDARNLFRGTAYHNTVQIDAVEQNELKPEWLFRLFETAKAEHISFEDGADAVSYVGRHHGYERLPRPVTHERALTLLKLSGELTIVDRLAGHGDHEVRWHFHLAPGVDVEHADACTLILAARTRRWRFSIPSELHPSIEPSWYSPSYGVRTLCLAINLAARINLGGGRHWKFSIQRASAS